MIRWIIVVSFLMAATPAELFAQGNPYTNRFNPYAPAVESGADPRTRRAYRERAVAAIGPQVRDFVETHGDEAVAAVFACSKPVAAKLAEFHSSGEMGKLSRPRDLLRVIAQPGHGDDVALWAIRHARELIDADSFEAYLISPLDYALGLKSLTAGAAEARATASIKPQWQQLHRCTRHCRHGSMKNCCSQLASLSSSHFCSGNGGIPRPARGKGFKEYPRFDRSVD